MKWTVNYYARSRAVADGKVIKGRETALQWLLVPFYYLETVEKHENCWKAWNGPLVIMQDHELDCLISFFT
jgi:hypothetical protein